MPNFYVGQTDYIDKLNELATTAEITAGITTATTQAAIATTQANSASASASTAATQAANAAASYDAFDDRYLGNKATNPTLDNDGAALLTGAIYWNTAIPEMRVWTGSAWVAVQSTSSATTATTQAGIATTQATNAANSATTATTQAGIATTQATNAANSATTATTQAGIATTQATNAAASYDAFDDRYLGNKATNPTLDNDGAALLTGAIYWNTAIPEMRVWTGSAWVAVQSTSSATTATTQAGIATTQATNAANSATTATTQAGIATTQATSATNSATTATTQAGIATTQATNASASATLAQNWAVQLGTPVSGGEYSSKYWAQYAAATITGTVIYRGSWSAATGAYPGSPNKGDYWKVSVAGTTNSIVYDVNDSIIYNGTTWDKIDSTDAVSSVAGRVGVVVLDKTDVGLTNVDNTSDALKPVSTATQTALNLKANLISPSFTTPALGTPASGIATNLTGLPLTTGVTGTLPIANGGTNATTKAAAFNSLSPVTTLGDVIYGDAANSNTRLAGNTLASKRFLTQTGNGTISAAPGWNTILDADLPTALTGKTYNALSLTAATTGFTIAGGTTSKTLTINNTLALSGTDASTLNIGTGGTLGTGAFANTGTSGTSLALLSGANTWGGYQTFSTGIGLSAGQVLTLDQGNIARVNGTAPAYYMSQDGTGRQHWYWNTYGSATPVFAVAAEDATDIMMTVNNNGNGGVFLFRTASGLGKLANDPITWTNVIYADLSVFSYKGVEVVRTTDTQTLTNKTINGLTLTAATTGFTIAGGTTSKTLTMSNSLALAGTDGSTLNISTGGTLGSAAFTNTTAYAPTAGSASITTLGTVTTGTWNAGTIGVGYGGTGAQTLAANNVLLGNGTGALQAVAPGTSGNILTSNGTTWTSTTPAPGGITYSRYTANVTAVDKQGIIADTSAGAFTVTLPASPSIGAQVVVVDGASWATNNLTVARNLSTIEGLAENMVLDIGGVSVSFIYDGTTWEMYSQVGGGGSNVATLTGIETLTNKTLVAPALGTPVSGIATNLTGLPLSTGVTGFLPVANGGTGQSSHTANGVLYASGTTTLTTGSSLVFNGTGLGIGGAPAAGYKLDITGGALGTTLGSQIIAERLSANSSNSDILEISNLRTAAGTDWTTSGWRLQQKIDSTWMGYIQFNGSGNNAGISFGTGTTTVSAGSIAERMKIDTSGNVNIAGLTASKPVFTDASKNLTSTGTVPVVNGGTGLATIAALSIPVANVLNTYTAITPAASQAVRVNAGGTAWEAYTPNVGTVTTASVAAANGFSGSVANATTTPTITVSTSIAGIIKGDGTAISAAVAGTDYVSPDVSTNFTAPQRPSLSAEIAPVANAITWDLTTTSILRIRLNASINTFNLTGTLSNYAGYQYQVIVRYNGGTSIAWPATVKFAGGALPTPTGTSGKVDVFNFVVASVDGGTTFHLLCTGTSQNL